MRKEIGKSFKMEDVTLSSRKRLVSLKEKVWKIELSKKKIISIWKNKRPAVVLASVFIVLTVVAGYFLLVSRAEVAYLYPMNCLGGWQNPQNAQGQPDVEEGAGPEAFNEGNSAVLRNTAAQIFCGDFQGNIPNDSKLKKIFLKLSWLVKTEEVKKTILPVAPSTDFIHPEFPIIPTEPVSETTPTPTPELIPESTPELTPSPTSQVFWQKIIRFVLNPLKKAFAEESFQPTPTPLEAVILRPEPPAAFLEILFTLDGTNWQRLVKINTENWQNLVLEMPNFSWEDLANFQVSIQSLPTIDPIPTVYLDSLRLEIEYESFIIEETPEEQPSPTPEETILPEEELEINFINPGREFFADENPQFLLPKIKSQNLLGKVKILAQPSTQVQQTVLIGPNAEEMNAQIDFVETDKNYKVIIKSVKNWQAGPYLLKIKIKHGNQVYRAETEFNWLASKLYVPRKVYSFLREGVPIVTEKYLNWYPEYLLKLINKKENIKIKTPVIFDLKTESAPILKGSCQKKYFVILIYRQPEDYKNDPASFVYNKAFPCQNGAYYQELNDLPTNLEEGIYYLLVAEQDEIQTWQPITALQPLRIKIEYK